MVDDMLRSHEHTCEYFLHTKAEACLPYIDSVDRFRRGGLSGRAFASARHQCHLGLNKIPANFACECKSCDLKVNVFALRAETL